jgi:Predicted transcriptional regulator
VKNITQCAFNEKNISRFCVNIYAMQHRGEIIRKVIYNSGFTVTEIAAGIGKSRRWMYLMFENSNVSLDIVLQIGKIIHYDFADEIKEFSPSQKIIEKSPANSNIEDSEAEYWKNKYLKLLEEYNELLKK